MSVLPILQKQSSDPLAVLAATLDAFVANPNADIYRLLFGPDTS